MKKMLFVGIDISADELVVAVERDGESLPAACFENDATGHRKLIRWLTKSTRPVRVCLEATGVYGLDLSRALHRTKGIEVMVANPRAIKDFARAFLQRSKTDALDAAVILEFVKRMPFQVWQAPPIEIGGSRPSRRTWPWRRTGCTRPITARS
jgi:transposase